MNHNQQSGLFIVSPIKFADKEYFVPRQTLEENNVSIKVASTTKEKALSMRNVQIDVDLTFDEIEIKDFVFMLIVGGFGVKQHLWDNTILHKLIKEAYRQKIIIGAICLSPVILAKAGILFGKKATVYRRIDALKEFTKYNVEYINKDVVEAGNIITAASPRCAEDFARAILNKLSQ